MGKRNTFRVAVVGHPSAEQWLLAAAFDATRKRNCSYELVTDPTDRSPDILVVDAEDEGALARWRARDPMGAIPTAFFVKVPPRAKCALTVARPITSGRIVEALDQISRRFLVESTSTTLRADAFRMEALAAAA